MQTCTYVACWNLARRNGMAFHAPKLVVFVSWSKVIDAGSAQRMGCAQEHADFAHEASAALQVLFTYCSN